MRTFMNRVSNLLDATTAVAMMMVLIITFGVFLHTIADAFAPIVTTIIVFLVVTGAIRAGWLNGSFAVIGFAVYITAWPVANLNVVAGQALAALGVLMGVIALYWTLIPESKAAVLAHLARCWEWWVVWIGVGQFIPPIIYILATEPAHNAMRTDSPAITRWIVISLLIASVSCITFVIMQSYRDRHRTETC